MKLLQRRGSNDRAGEINELVSLCMLQIGESLSHIQVLVTQHRLADSMYEERLTCESGK